MDPPIALILKKDADREEQGDWTGSMSEELIEVTSRRPTPKQRDRAHPKQVHEAPNVSPGAFPDHSRAQGTARHMRKRT